MWLVMLSGVFAGFAHTAFALAFNRPGLGLLGFSAASYAIITACALYFPRIKVYLYFFIPMPLWVLAVLMGVLLTGDLLRDGVLGGGVSHIGHLSGIITAIVLIKVPGILNALAGVQTPAGRRRRARQSGGRFGMGHPGRHSDPDDRYNDPHWYLDQ